MMGRKSGQIGMLMVDMGSMIPSGHLLKKIDATVNFDYIYELLAPYYPSVGRPSVDPMCMFKMLLVGYLYGIKSERRLVEGKFNLISPIAGSAAFGASDTIILNFGLAFVNRSLILSYRPASLGSDLVLDANLIEKSILTAYSILNDPTQSEQIAVSCSDWIGSFFDCSPCVSRATVFFDSGCHVSLSNGKQFKIREQNV